MLAQLDTAAISLFKKKSSHYTGLSSSLFLTSKGQVSSLTTIQARYLQFNEGHLI